MVLAKVYRWRRRGEDLELRINELKKSLGSVSEKSASERRGRVKAQQALREALAQSESHNSHNTIYPMRPIGTIQSCFSTRNGTPRQPLLVSLARACLNFDRALPVLDIKPYLPYSDSIQGALVPNWVQEDCLLAVASVSFSEAFSSSITSCWKLIEKKSLYGSADEFKSLITQVLSWDIRSMSQRNKPQDTSDADSTVYHLILEGLDVSYMIDNESNILVQDVSLPNNLEDVAET
ncbi:hypothetical protein DY000_02054456 [Brassica cretica]|uniref:TsaA-like domain-containing protein n=1 Tax=Brassica cretica TaxID=69181 RepID=A0ABQ7A4W0_BRACR|nr:hypothetical protein DY000_02054456 [Brassica cretica]